MVLSDPDALEAVLLREIDFSQRLLNNHAVRRGTPAREKLKNADIHRIAAHSRDTEPKTRERRKD